MASRGPDEAQLQGVLDAIYLFIPAQASKADTVIHLLSAVLVTDVEDDGLFSAVEQQSDRHDISTRSERRVAVSTHWAVT